MEYVLWPSVIVLVREKRAALHSYLALVVWVRSEEVRNEFCGFVRSHVSTLAALPGSQWPCSLIPRSRALARAPGCTRSPSSPPTPRLEEPAKRLAICPGKDCPEGGEERGPGQRRRGKGLVELQGDIERRTPRWASLDVGLQMADASVRECERSRSTPVFGVVVVG